jgi:transcriptional regulator GlxA family with amidase domain
MSGPAVAVALFDGVEELDWVGPWEVLATWSRGWPGDGASVFTVADHEGVVHCAKGARVLADHVWTDVPAFDVLVWPGGVGTLAQLGDNEVRERLRRAAASGVLLSSVCTGSLALADAGLLDGRPATTHWASLVDLVALGQGIEVRPDDRFVDDGDIVTAAGVSAGIDMALHLVARLHSAERSAQVRRRIQYDPAAPVASTEPARE